VHSSRSSYQGDPLFYYGTSGCERLFNNRERDIMLILTCSFRRQYVLNYVITQKC
jgi:hypothetical protein